MINIHTRLLVIHFAECFRFYRDVLQLTPKWGDESDDYASFTDGQDGRVVLAIFRRQFMSGLLGTTGQALDPQGQDRFLLIFDVENVDTVVDRIKQQGVQLELEPRNFPDWGYRGAFLRDPDGNLIELSCGIPFDTWSEELRRASEKYN